MNETLPQVKSSVNNQAATGAPLANPNGNTASTSAAANTNTAANPVNTFGCAQTWT